LPGRAWSPEEISAEILKKLKADVERSLGEPVTRAVITVPAYFNDAQRNATKEAGRLAGLKSSASSTSRPPPRSPTASTASSEKSKIAVYDLGGGTFDISILELNEGVFQVLSTNGNTRLGGDDLDKRLIDDADKIKAAGGPDLSASTRPAGASARGGRAGQNPALHRGAGRKSRCPFIAPIFILTTR
jgi:molecular chaperone DnaK